MGAIKTVHDHVLFLKRMSLGGILMVTSENDNHLHEMGSQEIQNQQQGSYCWKYQAKHQTQNNNQNEQTLTPSCI